MYMYTYKYIGEYGGGGYAASTREGWGKEKQEEHGEVEPEEGEEEEEEQEHEGEQEEEGMSWEARSISRLLWIVGLFCKRALQKKTIFRKRDLYF